MLSLSSEYEKIPIPIYPAKMHSKQNIKANCRPQYYSIQLVDTQKCCREIAASKTATEVTSRPVARETSCAG